MQCFFVFWMLVFGFSSGNATFMAQFFGSGDHVNIRRTTGFALTVNFGMGVLFFLVGMLLPEYVLTYGTAALFEGLYTDLINGEYEMIEVLENSVFDAGSENNALQSVTVYYEERNTVTEDALTP